jgi:hypothetical protein
MALVAIAGLPSPLHLAHAAHDLQVYSGGRSQELRRSNRAAGHFQVLEVEAWSDLKPALKGLSMMGKFAEMRALISDELVRTADLVGALHGTAGLL